MSQPIATDQPGGSDPDRASDPGPGSRVRGNRQPGERAMTAWRDPLAFKAQLRQTRAEFGGEPRRITNLKTSSALNDRPRASLMLPASVDPPLDYLAELRISVAAGSFRARHVHRVR